jgi:hypothetical protein
MESTLASLKDD